MPYPHDKRANGTEGDYWQSSTRDLGRDLKTLITPGERVSVCGHPGPAIMADNFPGDPFARFVDWWEPDYHTAHYFILSPRETGCWWREIREWESRREVIKRVERGGGLIYEIL